MASPRGRWSATRAVGRALSGHALVALGREAEAQAALRAAEKELADVPVSAVGIGVSRAQAQPWVDGLRGELLLRQGSRAEGRRILENVAGTLRGLAGPDAWIQAIFRLEAMARWARDASDWDLAGLLARQMLEHDPAYAGSHLAQALVAEHGNDAESAGRAFTKAADYWSEADEGLPELALARTGAARWTRIAATVPLP